MHAWCPASHIESRSPAQAGHAVNGKQKQTLIKKYTGLGITGKTTTTATTKTTKTGILNSRASNQPFTGA